MELRIAAAIVLCAALVTPHMARAGEVYHTIVWFQKPDALANCTREMKVDITKKFGVESGYKAEEWCNTDIQYMKCIEAASNEHRNDLIKRVRSLPECVNAPLPSNIAFDDIAQWVADQRLEELNQILLAPTTATTSATATASPK